MTGSRTRLVRAVTATVAVLAAGLVPASAGGTGGRCVDDRGAVDAAAVRLRRRRARAQLRRRRRRGISAIELQRRGRVLERSGAMPDGSLRGLVDNWGDNKIVARPVDSRAVARGRVAILRVVNHPITGPVFSGPQQLPFFCETSAFGLGPRSSRTARRRRR